MSRKRSRGEDWGALLVVAVCFAYGKEVIVAGFFMVALWLFLKFLEKRESSRALLLVNQMGLSMEADHQNMLAAQGDPYGTYGRYDAYTMPITRDVLDNYDDGMRDWR